MAFKKLKEMITDEVDEDAYYSESKVTLPDGNGKMILLEPRAFSESQQIADHLKKRNSVVVNLKRVTSNVNVEGTISDDDNSKNTDKDELDW